MVGSLGCIRVEHHSASGMIPGRFSVGRGLFRLPAQVKIQQAPLGPTMRADLRLPLSRERLDEAMRARGMIGLDQLHKPMAFGLHAHVHTMDHFRDWITLKDDEYGGMARSERDREPDMQQWVESHATVFGLVANALQTGMDTYRMRYWINRFSDASAMTRIRLQLNDWDFTDTDRGGRIFAISSAWSQVRQQLDHVMTMEAQKTGPGTPSEPC